MAKVCIYCGSPSSTKGKGEHVIHAALGGWKGIKNVCTECNNGFSQIDNELLTRSPLSTVRSDILGNVSENATTRDQDGGLIVDGKIDWQASSFTPFPQLVALNETKFVVFGTIEEMQRLEPSRFIRLFLSRARRCFWRHERRERKGKLFFPPPEPSFDSSRTRPSIQAPRPLVDVTPDSTMVVHAPNAHLRRVILGMLENTPLDLEPTSVSLQHQLPLPQMTRAWDALKTIRALVKIALNTLASQLDERFPSDGFEEAIAIVKGSLRVPEWMVDSWGFCAPSGFRELHAKDRHSLRVTYDSARRRWEFAASWFGGRVCTYVPFPGRRLATLTTLDVESSFNVPEGNPHTTWNARTTKLYLPLIGDIRKSAHDRELILPDYPIHNVKSFMRKTISEKPRPG